jgi:hypothetical protein
MEEIIVKMFVVTKTMMKTRSVIEGVFGVSFMGFGMGFGHHESGHHEESVRRPSFVRIEFHRALR